MRIRPQLIFLVVAALTPMLALTVVLTVQLWRLQQDSLQRRYQERVSALRIAVDVELESSIRLLQEMAASPDFDAPFQAEAVQKRFHRLLEGDGRGSVLGLVDSKGQVISQQTTLATPVASLDEETFGSVIRGSAPAVSNLIPIELNEQQSQPQLMTFIAVPVRREQRTQAVLYMGIEHTAWLALLRKFPLSSQATLTLNDRRGIIIARTLNDERWAGQPSAPEYWRQTVGQSEGNLIVKGLEGQTFYSAFSRLRNADWVLGTGVPRTEVEAALNKSARVLVVGVTIALLTALALALLLGRRISRALTSLASFARDLGTRRTSLRLNKKLAVDEAETVRIAMDEASALLAARTESLATALQAAQRATESKQAALSTAVATRERLQIALSSIDDQFFMLDREFRYTLVNRHVLAITKRSEEELLGQYVFDMFPDIVGTVFEQELRAAAADGQTRRFEFYYSPLDTWFENVLYPIEAGIAVLVVDITQRKQAENEINDSVARLRFLDNLSEATRSLSDPVQIMEVTTASLGQQLQVTRCTYADIEEDGEHFAIKRDWTDGTVASSMGQYVLSAFGPKAAGDLRAGRNLVLCDVARELTPDDGAAKFASLQIAALLCCPQVRDGRLVAVMALHQSTPRQWLPREISLLQAVADRSWAHLERSRATARLQAEDRRKDEFLATLAHELRNPLAPVRTASQVLRFVETDNAEIRWARDIIERQVQHLTRLIDDLLDVSRIANNKLELRLERLQLNEVLQASIEATRPLFQERQHQLTIDLPSQIITLDGDAVRLTQVFSNLLNNAAKYTAPGGCIALTAQVFKSAVEVCVEDNGIGIPTEQLPHLFELFFQVDQTLERTSGGLGIGLSLVQQLVRLHQGRVSVHSEGPGTGSRFTVWLPILSIDAQPLPPQGSLLVDAGRSSGSQQRRSPAANANSGDATLSSEQQLQRLVIVDDNRDAADSLATLLSLYGYQVSTAYDGQQGAELIEREKPLAAVLDLSMPSLNGYDACRLIRRRSNHPIVLVALSGYGKDSDRARSLEAGFDAHFTKPVDPASLHQQLTQLIAARATLVV